MQFDRRLVLVLLLAGGAALVFAGRVPAGLVGAGARARARRLRRRGRPRRRWPSPERGPVVVARRRRGAPPRRLPAARGQPRARRRAPRGRAAPARRSRVRQPRGAARRRRAGARAAARGRGAGGRRHGPAARRAPPAIVHLNSASADDLDALDGIGPSLAARIVAYRVAHGGFRSVDELDEVSGIGPDAPRGPAARCSHCDARRGTVDDHRRRGRAVARGRARPARAGRVGAARARARRARAARARAARAAGRRRRRRGRGRLRRGGRRLVGPRALSACRAIRSPRAVGHVDAVRLVVDGQPRPGPFGSSAIAQLDGHPVELRARGDLAAGRRSSRSAARSRPCRPPTGGFDRRTWLAHQGVHETLAARALTTVGRRGGLAGVARPPPPERARRARSRRRRRAGAHRDRRRAGRHARRSTSDALEDVPRVGPRAPAGGLRRQRRAARRGRARAWRGSRACRGRSAHGCAIAGRAWPTRRSSAADRRSCAPRRRACSSRWPG